MPSVKTSLFPSKTAFRGLDAERTFACILPDGSPPYPYWNYGVQLCENRGEPAGNDCTFRFFGPKTKKTGIRPVFLRGKACFFRREGV